MSKLRKSANEMIEVNHSIVNLCRTELLAPQIAHQLNLKLPTVYGCVNKLTKEGYLQATKNANGHIFYLTINEYKVENRVLPTRELIMNALKDGDKSVKELFEEINISRTFIGNVLTRLCTAYQVETYQKFVPEIGKEVSYYTIKKNAPTARKIYFSTDERLQGLQIESDAKRRNEQKSGKNYVSGSILSTNY